MIFAEGETILKYKVLIILFSIALLLQACREKTDEEIFYEAQKLIMNLNNYSCTAEITLYGNKSPETYVMKQWFYAPNKYKLEVKKPERLKGKITIYDGKRAWIRHPQIGQEWLMDDFENSVEQKMFLGHFIYNFVSSETGEIKKENMLKKEYVVLETEIPGNHPYFFKERLWFDIENYYPYRLEVLDQNGKIRIEINYHNFKYNEEKIKEDIFKIQGNI
ncbi:MAG: hypothetical protein PWQ37_1246 [Candidatus Petromonas sp.]|jgi:outer membrane lipoprotein-sorting protein|nr:hypothetical protein [Candidatus Petromonas sp.]